MGRLRNQYINPFHLRSGQNINLSLIVHNVNEATRYKCFMILDDLNRVVHVEKLKEIFLENVADGTYDKSFYDNTSSFTFKVNKKRRKNYIIAAKSEEEVVFDSYFHNGQYFFRKDSVPGISKRFNGHCFRRVKTNSEIRNMFVSYDDMFEETDAIIAINKRIHRTRFVPTSYDDVHIHREKNWKRNSKAKKSWAKHLKKGDVLKVENKKCSFSFND